VNEKERLPNAAAAIAAANLERKKISFVELRQALGRPSNGINGSRISIHYCYYLYRTVSSTTKHNRNTQQILCNNKSAHTFMTNYER